MGITFRPGVRENVGLWINLIGGTGSGKTYTGFELASGMAGEKPFAVIDTENRRALHYADQFKFDHAEIRAPFRPETYADAVLAADAAGFSVIMIDSGSHVWAGDGGVLDWQEDELTRMAGTDYNKREACKMASFIKPKMAHKQMVNVLLQVKAHIIFCLRAEPKIEMVKENGKWVVQPKKSMTGLDGWLPVCEKNLPFEATASFLLMADRPGYPHPIKLQEQHRAMFPLDRPISAQSGRQIAAWASGVKKAAPVQSPIASANPTTKPDGNGSGSTAAPAAELITADQAIVIEDSLRDGHVTKDRFLKAVGVGSVAMLRGDAYQRALDWIAKVAT